MSNPPAEMSCIHPTFAAHVDVTRLEDSGRFAADVRVRCTACNRPFTFLGLRAGLAMDGAAVSVDGQEARLAIAPADTVVRVSRTDRGEFWYERQNLRGDSAAAPLASDTRRTTPLG